MVGVVLAIFTGIVIVVITGAWPAMKRFGPGFMVNTGWDPVASRFWGSALYRRHDYRGLRGDDPGRRCGSDDCGLHHRAAATLVAGTRNLPD